jgi:spore germination cell wall hydrolase CwlJ-like protein
MAIGAAVMCLALNIYFEARSEEPMGQLAVAEVTLNRVASSRYPNNVCDVVWQRKQFSWTHDGKSDKPKDAKAWDMAVRAAKLAMKHRDVVIVGDEVTHYHAEYVTPYWTTAYERVAKVGTHIFYKAKG